jgi:hypothetical protein
MLPIVLVENEVTVSGRYDHWQDVTGERYQFPNQYRKKVLPGRRFVYYRGVRRASNKRGTPEYFGHGVIGDVEFDTSGTPAQTSAHRKWICNIDDYVPFPAPVPAKIGNQYIEVIPANFWSVGVREIPEATYLEILNRAGYGPPVTAPSLPGLELPPIESVTPDVVVSSLLPVTQRQTNTGVGRSRGSSRHSPFSAALGRRGEEVVKKHLESTLSQTEAATIRWVSKEGETPGWDIEYKSTNGLVCIEAKASSGPALPTIELTAGEWRAAEIHRERYLLALVANVKTRSPLIEYLCDPFGLVASGKLRLEPQIWRLNRDHA